MKKISIIVPVYKVEKYLEKCIDSILSQTYKNIEIILINDGSPDNCGHICDEYAAKDKRIIVIHKENAGVSRARNDGLKIASGDYIGFVDSDDYVEENLYEILMRNIEIENADLSVCNYVESENPNKVIKKKEKISKPQKISNSKALEWIITNQNFLGYVTTKLYKKKILDENQIVFNQDITICEDLLFNVSYINKIKTVVIDKIKLYHYLQRNDSALNTSFNRNRLTCLIAYKEMFEIYRNYPDNLPYLWQGFSTANFGLKLKIYAANINDDELKKELENNLKKYHKKLLKSKKISFQYKIKLLIKKHLFWMILLYVRIINFKNRGQS